MNHSQKTVSIVAVAAMLMTWAALFAREPAAVSDSAASTDAAAPPIAEPQPIASLSEAAVASAIASASSPAAASDAAISTTQRLERLRALDDAQLELSAARVDDEISRADLVRRANESSLDDQEMDHFRALLRERNAVQIAKSERLLAKLSVPGSR